MTCSTWVFFLSWAYAGILLVSVVVGASFFSHVSKYFPDMQQSNEVHGTVCVSYQI